MLLDSYNRPIKDLRISVTDRCNFRCFYCLPTVEPARARNESVLTFEEIARAARVFARLGIEKIRVTGGEPLLRLGIPDLVQMLAEIDGGSLDLALTTNGHLFTAHARALKDAGLKRVTFSLDSLDAEQFAEITKSDSLGRVVEAIRLAIEMDFHPVKVNAVIVRGVNDDQVIGLARFARETGTAMRFIEYMPLDSGDEWSREQVVSGREILKVVEGEFPLQQISVSRGSETAWRFGFADGSAGEIGIIAPVTEIFCGQCSRIRLTADGQIRTCLFSNVEHDLRGALRSGADDEEVAEFIRGVVRTKEAHHNISSSDFKRPLRSMSFIGG